jgi:hypothetical protein
MSRTFRKQTFGESIKSMKFTQELRTFLDARLVVFAATTIVVGFGVAHWSGLRAAAESTAGGQFAALAYDIAFGQAVSIVLLIVVAAAVVGSFVKGLKSYEARRLAVQLMMTTVIFAALNLALLAYRSTGS